MGSYMQPYRYRWNQEKDSQDYPPHAMDQRIEARYRIGVKRYPCRPRTWKPLPPPLSMRWQYYYRYPNDCDHTRFLGKSALRMFNKRIEMDYPRNDMTLFDGIDSSASFQYPEDPRGRMHCATVPKYKLWIPTVGWNMWPFGFTTYDHMFTWNSIELTSFVGWDCRENVTFACEGSVVHPNTKYI